MKQALLTLSILASLSGYAWNVETLPGQRNALIEEFTGIQCPNCPQGHEDAARIMALNPGKVYSVAIHAGYFSDPRHGQPDYKTEEGIEIHDHFGVSSYPSGMVNRQDHERYGQVQWRADWSGACRDVMAMVSPVNLWSACSYDAATKNLKVNIEGYITADMTDPRLNVFLLQSEIIGPQSGGNMGEEYHHRHMLRATLGTGSFGEALTVKTAGNYFSKEINYSLPDAINEVAVDVRNIEVLVFVTDGQEDVSQVTSCHPDVSDMEPVFVADFRESPLGIMKNYALNYLEVLLFNHGNEVITSADFDVMLNKEKKMLTWNGNLPAHSAQLIKVSLDGVWENALDCDDNDYAIRMMKANGKDVETSSIRGTFGKVFTYPTKMKIQIKTDMYAGDNTYRIIDRDGNVVKEFGPYENGKVETYEEELTLEEGKIYGLEVYDKVGDGIKSPLGSVKLYDMEGKSVTQLREIDDYGVRQFFYAKDGGAGVNGIAAEAEIMGQIYYDLTGREIANPAAGIFIEKIIYNDGRVEINKIAK